MQSAYNNNSVSARLTQPLFRLDSWFNFKRSKKLTDASEADFAYAQQNLIIRTVEKYFGVLRALKTPKYFSTVLIIKFCCA